MPPWSKYKAGRGIEHLFDWRWGGMKYDSWDDVLAFIIGASMSGGTRIWEGGDAPTNKGLVDGNYGKSETVISVSDDGSKMRIRRVRKG